MTATMTQTATDLETCGRCGGSGIYYGAGIVENGVFKGFSGTCFRCKGRGMVTPYQNELGNRGIVLPNDNQNVRNFRSTVCADCGIVFEGSPYEARYCGNCSEDRAWDFEKMAQYETAETMIEAEEETAERMRETPLLIADGTYTLVYDNDEYFTFRVDTKTSGKFTGRRMIEFLRGANNELDFNAFGFVNENSINVWRRFEGGKLVERAREIEALIRNDRDALEAAGIAYAELSKRCRRCGRVLTVPASLAAGYGPDCAVIMGVAY